MQLDYKEILSKIKPHDIVLDIGGWDRPLKRANKVIDLLPYATRSINDSIGDTNEKECFSTTDWIVRDVCDRTPFPFKDKEVDFVFCTHLLEDIRDPIWVCGEIVRIAKKGYIEIPSRALETTRGIEKWQYTGYYHHRWLIERDDNGTLVFLHKTPALLKYPKYYLNLYVSSPVVGFYWDDSFNFMENLIIDKRDLFKNLEAFVKSEKKKMSIGKRVINGLLYLIPTWLLNVILSPRKRKPARKY